tara:strand:- start:3616 stop:3864 length:249 start_codon:yes stop_codon:yes gene_type:complete
MKYFVIYAWGDCPFCLSAKELLEEKGERHMMIYLDNDDVLLNYFQKLYDWPTVPIILFHNTEEHDTTLIGGYTDLIAHLEAE